MRELKSDLVLLLVFVFVVLLQAQGEVKALEAEPLLVR